MPEQQSAAVAGWVGRVLAGHRIDALIGEGGMGVVYRASHLQLRRTVALKVLPPSLTADREYRHRFEREAAIAASLEHPNVVPIYDAGYANGVLYLSMRFVDGEDLSAVLQRHGRLDVEPLCALLEPVADALDAVHAAGLVHRDVKPGNVLISRSGRRTVYLCDFGIAKAAAGGRELTAAGQYMGTRALLIAGADRGPVDRRPLRPVRPGLPRLPRADRPGALPPSRDGGGDLRPPRGRSAPAEPAPTRPPARGGRRRGPGHREAARAAVRHLHGLHRRAAGGGASRAPRPGPDDRCPRPSRCRNPTSPHRTRRPAGPPPRSRPPRADTANGAADACQPTAPPNAATDAVPAPTDVRAERSADDPSITVTWTATGGGDVEYKVTRLAADGRRHVVGRTRATYLVDGAVAPDSPVPAYEVLARVGPKAAAPVRSAPADPGGIPAVRNLTVSPGGALVFDWPDGVTEAMVVVRGDRPPEAPDDPDATAWKITNMRYQLDGGLVLPKSVALPCHVAVASCRRKGGTLVVAPGFGASARAAVGG